MHINVDRREDGIAILKIQGEFWESEWSLHEQIKRQLEEDYHKIVVDFSHSERMNSQGIGVVVASLTSVQDAGGSMKIAGANEKILEVLKLLQLYTVLDTYSTVEEAVAAFA